MLRNDCPPFYTSSYPSLVVQGGTGSLALQVTPAKRTPKQKQTDAQKASFTYTTRDPVPPRTTKDEHTTHPFNSHPCIPKDRHTTYLLMLQPKMDTLLTHHHPSSMLHTTPHICTSQQVGVPIPPYNVIMQVITGLEPNTETSAING